MNVYNKKLVFKCKEENSDISKVESFYLFGEYIIETHD
jgi:hypothetical protein